MNTDHYPQLDKAEQLAESSYEIALAVKVDCADVLAIAGDELRSIVTRRKDIEGLRLSITRPMDEAKKRVMELFKVPESRLEQAESLLRNEIARYQREEREKAEAIRRMEEARLAAEREATEQRLREAQVAAERARASGNIEAATEALVLAETASDLLMLADIAPPTAMASAPSIAGISSRKNWKAEVIDFKALVLAAAERAKQGDDFLLGFLDVNAKAIHAAARSMQARLSVAGIRVYAEESLAVSRKEG